jgi:hypothetical protein
MAPAAIAGVFALSANEVFFVRDDARDRVRLAEVLARDLTALPPFDWLFELRFLVLVAWGM